LTATQPYVMFRPDPTWRRSWRLAGTHEVGDWSKQKAPDSGGGSMYGSWRNVVSVGLLLAATVGLARMRARAEPPGEGAAARLAARAAGATPMLADLQELCER